MLTHLVDVFLLTVTFPYHPWMVYLPKFTKKKSQPNVGYICHTWMLWVLFAFFGFSCVVVFWKWWSSYPTLGQRDMLVPRRAPVTYWKDGPQLVKTSWTNATYKSSKVLTSFFANASCIHSKIPSMLQLQNKTLCSLSKGSCAAASARIFFRKCIVNVMAHNWMIQKTYRTANWNAGAPFHELSMDSWMLLVYNIRVSKMHGFDFEKKVLRPCIAGMFGYPVRQLPMWQWICYAHLCASISLLSGCIWSYWNHLDANPKTCCSFLSFGGRIPLS